MEGQNCNQNDNPQVAVVMVPFPAQGHINQLFHLSHLITSNDIPVYLTGSTTHNRQAKLRLHGRNTEGSSKIHFHDFELPLPPISSVQPNPDTSSKFPAHLLPVFDATLHLREPVFQLLQELSTKFRRIIIIHDNLMTSVVQDVKSIPNAEAYAFLSVSAFTIFFKKWESMTEKPFELGSHVPRCIPPREGSFPPVFEEFIVNQHKLLNFESGRLFNTSRVIEGRYMELLSKLPSNVNKKHFAIGPFNPVEIKGTNKTGRHRCLEWLDKQGKDSVIYVSFGTMTTMNYEQIRELAIGLERSEQRFIWALRCADEGEVFSEDNITRSPQLPEGYEERVKNRGVLVRDWAPQLEILAHPSTGGFMSHCGWNSCLESITMGVPIAAWPMHSDQPKNSILVTEELQIGILVREWAHRMNLVTSMTVEKAVRTLMTAKKGEEMRKRAVGLGEVLRGSVAEGGISRLEMDSFIGHITR